MNLAEFQTALERLDPSQFEQFVVELLARSGRFTDVRGSSAPDKGVDIEATEAAPDAVRWVIQVKHRRVASADVIRYMREVARLQYVVSDRVNVALVVSGLVTEAIRHRFRAHDIYVWDASDLIQLATPNVLAKYLGVDATPPPANESASDSKSHDFESAFGRINPGQDDWPKYQRFVADVLEYLFCPPLQPPKYELADEAARNRRDVIFENAAPDGLWSQLRDIYAAHYIVVDAKNNKGALKKDQVVDIAHYLKPYGCGMFALLISRKGAGASALHAIREQWIGGHKLIVPLSDAHLIEMIQLKAKGGRPEETIRRVIGDFRMSL